MKKYKLVISENQDKNRLDTLLYTCDRMLLIKTAAARPKAEEQQAITLLREEETACPTQ
jgi:hypothetical protein